MSDRPSAVYVLKLVRPREVTKRSGKKNFATETRAGDDESVTESGKSNFEEAGNADYECTSDSLPQAEASSSLVCDFCNRQFKYNKSLQNHLIRHSQTKPVEIGKRLKKRAPVSEAASITGEKCCVESENVNILKGHSAEEYEEVGTETQVPVISLECSTCMRTFKTVTGRKRHRCGDLDQQQFVCDYCGQVFRSKYNLNDHMNIHTRKKAFICDICNRIFAHRCTLRQHRYYVHIGEQQHKCEVCGKCLAHSAALKQHVRLHTGELPYECDKCHRKFNSRGNLRNHYYVHTGEYPFSCDVCNKGYREKKRLLAHYVIHSDPVKEAAYIKKMSRDRETVCNVCGKEFSKPCQLKVHYRTHTGERPYKCEECGMSFTQKIALKNHSYTHTNEYPFICLVCSKGYRFCSELKSHLQKLHPEHSAL